MFADHNSDTTGTMRNTTTQYFQTHNHHGWFLWVVNDGKSTLISYEKPSTYNIKSVCFFTGNFFAPKKNKADYKEISKLDALPIIQAAIRQGEGLIK